MFAPSSTLAMLDLLVGPPTASDPRSAVEGGSSESPTDSSDNFQSMLGQWLGLSTAPSATADSKVSPLASGASETRLDDDQDFVAVETPTAPVFVSDAGSATQPMTEQPITDPPTTDVTELPSDTAAPSASTVGPEAQPRPEAQALAETTGTALAASLAPLAEDTAEAAPSESPSPLLTSSAVQSSNDAKAMATARDGVDLAFLKVPTPSTPAASPELIDFSPEVDSANAPQPSGAEPTLAAATASILRGGIQWQKGLTLEFTGDSVAIDAEPSAAAMSSSVEFDVEVDSLRVENPATSVSASPRVGRILDVARRAALVEATSEKPSSVAADLDRAAATGVPTTPSEASAAGIATSAEIAAPAETEALVGASTTIPSDRAVENGRTNPAVRDDAESSRPPAANVVEPSAEPSSTQAETDAEDSGPDSDGAAQSAPAHVAASVSHATTTVGVHPQSMSASTSLHHSAQRAVADSIVRMGQDQLLASATPRKAVVELTPAHLGRVQIEVVQLPNRSVEVHLTAQTHEAHLALEADADDLVEHLRAHSIEVTKVEVKADADSSDSRGRELLRERSTPDSNDGLRRDGRQGRNSSRQQTADFTDYRYWEAIR